jgi:hypothetical protein
MSLYCIAVANLCLFSAPQHIPAVLEMIGKKRKGNENAEMNQYSNMSIDGADELGEKDDEYSLTGRDTLKGDKSKKNTTSTNFSSSFQSKQAAHSMLTHPHPRPNHRYSLPLDLRMSASNSRISVLESERRDSIANKVKENMNIKIIGGENFGQSPPAQLNDSDPIDTSLDNDLMFRAPSSSSLRLLSDGAGMFSTDSLDRMILNTTSRPPSTLSGTFRIGSASPFSLTMSSPNNLDESIIGAIISPDQSSWMSNSNGSAAALAHTTPALIASFTEPTSQYTRNGDDLSESQVTIESNTSNDLISTRDNHLMAASTLSTNINVAS